MRLHRVQVAAAAVGDLFEHLEKQLFFRLGQTGINGKGTLKQPGGAGGVDNGECRSLSEQ